MSVSQAIILGLLQGATEFFPVSSSGHLVLVPWMLNWPNPGIGYDAIVHLGTLCAAVLYFRRDIGQLALQWWESFRHLRIETLEARLSWLVLASAIPAALLGWFWEDLFQRIFGSPRTVSAFLLLTGVLLVVGERFGHQDMTLGKMGLSDALVMGLAQACALAPGISRSGATIAAGLFRGLYREDAARFSLLMLIPIIFGAAGAHLLRATSAGLNAPEITHLAAGFVAASLGGYVAIRFLLNHLKAHSLRPFAYYCWGLGLIGLITGIVR